jgi:hypothetical protein
VGDTTHELAMIAGARRNKIRDRAASGEQGINYAGYGLKPRLAAPSQVQPWLCHLLRLMGEDITAFAGILHIVGFPNANLNRVESRCY